MPHRTSRNGSYRIDRVFRGVGRLACASGATTRRDLQARNALLTRLYQRGRFDLLRAVKSGTLTVTQLVAADRSDELDRLTGERAVLARPLWATVAAWIGPTPGPTQKRYGVSFAALQARAGLPTSATVESLGGVDWSALHARWPASNTDWNQLRRAVGRFLSVQLGDGKPSKGVHHPFRQDVMCDFPRFKETERVPDINGAVFWRIMQHVSEHVRPCYITLAALGLRTGEYLALTRADLRPDTHRVALPHTKTDEADSALRVDARLWHYIVAAVPSPVRYKWLRLHWKRALKAAGADVTLRLHDLRHLPAMLLTDAGRSEASVQTTMRHATAGMTRRYARQRDRGENARALADVLLAKGA